MIIMKRFLTVFSVVIVVVVVGVVSWEEGAPGSSGGNKKSLTTTVEKLKASRLISKKGGRSGHLILPLPPAQQRPYQPLLLATPTGSDSDSASGSSGGSGLTKAYKLSKSFTPVGIIGRVDDDGDVAMETDQASTVSMETMNPSLVSMETKTVANNSNKKMKKKKILKLVRKQQQKNLVSMEGERRMDEKKKDNFDASKISITTDGILDNDNNKVEQYGDGSGSGRWQGVVPATVVSMATKDFHWREKLLDGGRRFGGLIQRGLAEVWGNKGGRSQQQFFRGRRIGGSHVQETTFQQQQPLPSSENHRQQQRPRTTPTHSPTPSKIPTPSSPSKTMHKPTPTKNPLPFLFPRSATPPEVLTAFSPAFSSLPPPIRSRLYSELQGLKQQFGLKALKAARDRALTVFAGGSGSSSAVDRWDEQGEEEDDFLGEKLMGVYREVWEVMGGGGGSGGGQRGQNFVGVGGEFDSDEEQGEKNWRPLGVKWGASSGSGIKMRQGTTRHDPYSMSSLSGQIEGLNNNNWIGDTPPRPTPPRPTPPPKQPPKTTPPPTAFFSTDLLAELLSSSTKTASLNFDDLYSSILRTTTTPPPTPPPTPRRPVTKFFAPIPLDRKLIKETLRGRYGSPVPRYVVELAEKLLRDKDVQGIVRVRKVVGGGGQGGSGGGQGGSGGGKKSVEYLYPVRG